MESDIELFHALKVHSVPYEVRIMIADTEAIDEVFCEMFTGGNESEFLRRCETSINKTNDYFYQSGVSEHFLGTSFFKEFGREKFLKYQGLYYQTLLDRYGTDGSFRSRINLDRAKRNNMYKQMYPSIFDNSMNVTDRDDFLIGRTLRTSAQYLTLGRLIAESSQNCYPVIICHPTRNIGFFNDRNKFLLSEDGNKIQETIPVFEMKQTVY